MPRDVMPGNSNSSLDGPQPQKSAGPGLVSGSAGKISVLLADDHNVVREGLRLLLEAAGDIRVIAEADNGRSAVQKAAECRPNVLVLDLAMPQLNGVEAARQILKDNPKSKILILSSYNDEGRVRMLINAGVTGYLVKQTAASELVTAVREVHKGNAFFSASISRQLVEQMQQSFVQTGSHSAQPHHLTSREVEVLQLIAEGYANKQIADVLGISIKTVEKHRQQVMDKLNIHEVAGLTRYALANGITTPVDPPSGF